MEPLECPSFLTKLERRAWEFAVEAHGEQRRKFTNEPYVKHLERVAQTVKEYDGTTSMVMAALLHDVLEDTPVKPPELQAFLEEVCQGTEANAHNILLWVEELTDEFIKSAYPGHNRRRRKEMEVQRLSSISLPAQAIKLADIIDNTRDIARNDRNFAKVYIPEILALVEVLKNAQPFRLFLLACYEVQKALYSIKKKKVTEPIEQPLPETEDQFPQTE
ncbi:HD domain-containing protein [Rufibacter sp. DG15C]|uniref:HD domain-containing protein n=1 Tax=Rufibacter sp. DG15C TaxID=1379909 RepID=UPI0009E67576|nr:HD domain-containing protein [Rufibacter sp. DG15C]